MSYRLVSSILRGAWAIDQGYAHANLSLVHSFLNGKVDGKVFRSGDGETENVFYIDADGKRVGYGDKLQPGSTMVMPITGVILKYNGDCGEPGMVLRESLLRSADENPNIKGILLLVDSPGGEAYGTFSFAEAVRNCKKPTIALVESGMAASAAFWIASAANKFYVTKKVDQVGSCGVLCTLADPTGAYENAGIKIRTVYAPESSEKNLPYRQLMNEDSATLVEQDLSVLAQYFISAIKEYRGTKLTGSAWEKGALYYADDAIKMGLVDGYSSFDSAIAELQSSKSFQKSTNKKQTTMKGTNYPAIAKAAGWSDGHESDEQGLFLSHEDAEKLEAQVAQLDSLQTQATDAAAAAAQASKDKETAAAQLATATEAHAAEVQNLKDTHMAELSALQTVADNWKAKAEELGAQPANNGTPLNGPDTSGEEQPAPVKQMDEVTAQAMAIYNKNKLKA